MPQVREMAGGATNHKWRFTQQGKHGHSTLCSVPCARFDGACYLLLQPPISRNGGGSHLNQYSITLQIRFGIAPGAMETFEQSGW